MTPHKPPADAQSRFSDRVADYVRFRPGYPPAVIDLLRRRTGLSAGCRVADIGSGTGIFTRLLLATGAEVFAVEPNAEMRAAAETMFGSDARFHSFAAPGEATGLADQSVDLITSAQAFHWLNRSRARAEFDRILRPGGRIALVWNVRQTDSSPFLRDYEALLLEFATDYARVRHENVDEEALRGFFPGGLERHTFPNAQGFDAAGLRGRLLSSSYTPGPDDPRRGPMLEALDRLHARHAREGRVEIHYDTEVILGH